MKEQHNDAGTSPSAKRKDVLRQIVTGHFAWSAIPTISRARSALRRHVVDLWPRLPRRCSEKGHMAWDCIATLGGEWLPKPRVLHPWPNHGFAVIHPR